MTDGTHLERRCLLARLGQSNTAEASLLSASWPAGFGQPWVKRGDFVGDRASRACGYYADRRAEGQEEASGA